ncbi:hypothetical protein [[Scytonema hofmanni] UTEX B 1581]|nr:hypothetical protein [[Scytonema hofmanni] UTEX B 1581]
MDVTDELRLVEERKLAFSMGIKPYPIISLICSFAPMGRSNF